MRFRVLTYNIHRAIGLDRQFRPDRIVEIIGHYQPDVALLQEVDEGVPRSREIDMARELAQALEFPHLAIGHNVSLRKGRYGNATLSRHPIVRERNIDLTIGGRKRRGCQHTTLAGPAGAPVEVFNVHLGLSARERLAQLMLLVRSHEFAALDENITCLVAGDFNDWRSALRVAFTDGLRFDCASDRRGRPLRSIKTYPAFSPSGGLDKIYHRGPLRLLSARACGISLARVASDHLPLVADFEL